MEYVDGSIMCPPKLVEPSNSMVAQLNPAYQHWVHQD
jgi:hypothetical protein